MLSLFLFYVFPCPRSTPYGMTPRIYGPIYKKQSSEKQGDDLNGLHYSEIWFGNRLVKVSGLLGEQVRHEEYEKLEDALKMPFLNSPASHAQAT